MNNKRKHGNILLVANYESSVGYAWWLMDNFWVEIARYCTCRKQKVYLIYPKVRDISEQIRKGNITVSEHDFSDRSKESLVQLKRIVINNNIRSVYLTDRPYFDLLYMKLRKWGVRSIVLHDHTPGERSKPSFLKKYVKQCIYSIPGITCDLYIGVSKFVYNRFLTSGCLPKSKCSYVLNGIVPIDIKKINKNAVHDEYNLPEDAVIIVTTGRATYYKGIDFIIKCANILINHYKLSNASFLHIGDGPNLQDFKNEANLYGLKNKFIFAGQRDDVRRLLQSCHIGIQASKGEAFSLSILEYMSAGLATVVPDHCGNREAITNSENGVLYTPGDLESIVDILRDLMNNQEKRQLLGKCAISTIKDKFDIRNTNANFINCIKDKL